MLHILLSLLKIIGIFLLILFCILLFLIVAVLAAPVTYELSGDWKGTMQLQGRIRWLYRIVGISICMENMQPQVRVSFFGHVPGSGKKKKSGEDRQEYSAEEPFSEEELFTENRTGTEKLFPEVSPECPEPEKVPVSEKTDSEEGANLPEKQEPRDLPDSEIENCEDLPDSADEPDMDRLLDEELQRAEKEKKSADRRKKAGKKRMETENSEERNSLSDMVNRVLDFINEPSVRRLLSRFQKSICHIFRHLRPSRLQIQARVGTDDPALTGKIMELAAVLYAFYQENIQITADFDEKVLEAGFFVKGWLVPGYLIIKLLGMALRLFLSRECRAFYGEIKESLT